MPTLEMNMDRPNPIESDFGDRDVTPELILESIRGVVADVGEFLSDWVRRVDQKAASRCQSATPDVALREQMEEFQSMKSYWEAKRKSEEQRLKEKADQLTDAWIRLEDQQRAVLQSKESHPGAIHQRGAATPTTPLQSLAAAAQGTQRRSVQCQPSASLNPDYPAPADVAQWNEQRASETACDYALRRGKPGIGVELGGRDDTVGRVDVVASPGAEKGIGQTATALVGGSRESAVRQFQRLRREIDASRSSSGQS